MCESDRSHEEEGAGAGGYACLPVSVLASDADDERVQAMQIICSTGDLQLTKSPYRYPATRP